MAIAISCSQSSFISSMLLPMCHPMCTLCNWYQILVKHGKTKSNACLKTELRSLQDATSHRIFPACHLCNAWLKFRSLPLVIWFRFLWHGLPSSNLATNLILKQKLCLIRMVPLALEHLKLPELVGACSCLFGYKEVSNQSYSVCSWKLRYSPRSGWWQTRACKHQLQGKQQTMW